MQKGSRTSQYSATILASDYENLEKIAIMTGNNIEIYVLYSWHVKELHGIRGLCSN